MPSEVEENLKRIQSHKGVKGVLIMNSEVIPIRSNLSTEDTENYAALVSQLALKHLELCEYWTKQMNLHFCGFA
jgi:dynein light chain roadblock-type